MRPMLAAVLLLLATPTAALAKGHFVGGHGSSHKGGHYVNPKTGNHIHKRKH